MSNEEIQLLYISFFFSEIVFVLGLSGLDWSLDIV